MVALAAGELREGEEIAAQALAIGERAEPGLAIPAYRLQRYMLCDFRDRLEEVETTIRTSIAEYPARPVFRCALVHLQARLGRYPEAQHMLTDLVRDNCAALPTDWEWLYGMSLLAEASALLYDADAASILYALLLPWESLTVSDHPEGSRGAASRYLGILATALSRWEEATKHFEDAIELNTRMGARPWLAHTQQDYVRMLLARNESPNRDKMQQLISPAIETYRDLGMRLRLRLPRFR